MAPTELSEEELVRVRAVIGEPLDHVAVIGNTLLGEYCSTARAIDETMKERRNPLAFFFYDRHRTLNTYGRYMHLVRQNAEAGQWAQLDDATDRYFVDLDKQKLRNFIGWNFLQMATPAVQKTFEHANDVNQKRDSLLKRIDERLAVERKG